MSQFAVPTPDQTSPTSHEIVDTLIKKLDFNPNVLCDINVSSSIILKNINPVDQFGLAQFASDECGDTMWNEENLNPPSQN